MRFEFVYFNFIFSHYFYIFVITVVSLVCFQHFLF